MSWCKYFRHICWIESSSTSSPYEHFSVTLSFRATWSYIGVLSSSVVRPHYCFLSTGLSASSSISLVLFMFPRLLNFPSLSCIPWSPCSLVLVFTSSLCMPCHLHCHLPGHVPHCYPAPAAFPRSSPLIPASCLCPRPVPVHTLPCAFHSLCHVPWFLPAQIPAVFLKAPASMVEVAAGWDQFVSQPLSKWLPIR